MHTLTKKLFYENRDLNLIREMKVGKFGMDKTGLMVVGGSGACLLTLEGQPVRYITYKSLNLSSVQVIELPKQNTYAFVAGGLWGGPAAVVMDSEGKVKWRYDAKFKAMGAPAVIDLGASDDRKFQRVASWDAPHPYPGTSYLSLVAAEPLGPPNQRSGLVSLFTGTGSWRKTPRRRRDESLQQLQRQIILGGQVIALPQELFDLLLLSSETPRFRGAEDLLEDAVHLAGVMLVIAQKLD